MHESALEDIIARADLQRPGDADDAPSFALHVGRPIPADVDWQCSHQLTGLSGEDRVITAYGVDSFQALYLCIELARARIFDVERRFGIRLLGWDSAQSSPDSP